MRNKKRKVPEEVTGDDLVAWCEKERWMAGAYHAITEAEGDIDAAIAIFREHVSKPWPKNPREYIENKLDRIKSGDVDMPLRRTPRRPSSVSDELARMTAELFRQGIEVDGGVYPFRNWKDVSIFGGSRPSSVFLFFFNLLVLYGGF